MAEEFLQGGVVCGESWWNSSSLAFNSFAGNWASKMEMESARSRHDHWNHDYFLRDTGRWEENNCKLLLDWNSDSLKPSLNCIISSSSSEAGLPLSSSHSQPQQDATINNQQLTINSSRFLWNFSNVPSNFLPSPQPHFINSSLTSIQKPHIHIIPATAKQHEEEEEEEDKDDKDVVKKASHEPSIKRPRTGTPSPMPTFKVRKEKLGDRITALQQLVSPFGKTDTASVLHEAIEYIKFLHDQVNALSTPYLKNESPPLQQRQQRADRARDEQGLQSIGLCLVNISSTFPIAPETESDFWTPTFDGR